MERGRPRPRAGRRPAVQLRLDRTRPVLVWCDWRLDQREGHMPSSARVALITGCGKPIGIGNSTARALAAAGVTVIVSDVVSTGVANEHNVAGDMDNAWRGVDSLVEELVRGGRTASSTLGDVSVEADAGRMVEEVLGHYGRLDI